MFRRASRRERTRPPSSTAAETNGDLLLAFFNDQLTREYARRSSLDSRAQAIVTVNTAITSAAVAVATLTKTNPATLGAPLRWLLITAAAGFVLATVAGLIAYWPRGTRAADLSTLKGFHGTAGRAQPREQTSKVLARYVLVELGPLRKGNLTKGIAVRIAGSLQVTAVAMLAAALVVALT